MNCSGRICILFVIIIIYLTVIIDTLLHSYEFNHLVSC